MTKFQNYTYFPSQGINQHMYLNSLLLNWWCHNHFLKEEEEKRERWKYKTLNILKRKKLFRWNKNVFHKVLVAIIWCINEEKPIQALSFMLFLVELLFFNNLIQTFFSRLIDILSNLSNIELRYAIWSRF